jgi:ParB family chromosome partitioning protein
MVQKLKLDPKAAMRRQADSSTAEAVDRFAAAQAVTERRPSGLAVEEGAAPAMKAQHPASEQVVKFAERLAPGAAFDISCCVVGAIVQVPLALIDANALGPRQIYLNENVDLIAQSLPSGQDVAVSGFVKEGRIHLIDGGTRLRAARITDRGYLDVKIEPAPKSDIELYERAREFNERRSPTSALDFAISIKLLMDRGALVTHRDVAERIKGPDGGKLSEGTVSKYLRIARMPEKVQRSMAESAETSTFAALYAVSEMFTDNQDEAELEKAIEIALEITEEVKRRKLNRNQLIALVKHRLEGPKSRDRSAALPLDFGRQKGQVKMFAKKGQIDLTLSGLVEEEMPEVRSVLVKALEEYMEKKRVTE